MGRALKSLALLVLLLAAQYGSVVHDLSHLASAGQPGVRIDAGVAETACSLCTAFEQASTPAFSHSFHVPPLVRAAIELSSALPHALIDAAVPRPRSRGPPAGA
jgi:hypothetical protein